MRQSYPTLPLPLPFRFIHLTKHRSKRNVRPINLYRDKNRSRRVIFVDSTQEKKEETNKGKKKSFSFEKRRRKMTRGRTVSLSLTIVHPKSLLRILRRSLRSRESARGSQRFVISLPRPIISILFQTNRGWMDIDLGYRLVLLQFCLERVIQDKRGVGSARDGDNGGMDRLERREIVG